MPSPCYPSEHLPLVEVSEKLSHLQGGDRQHRRVRRLVPRPFLKFAVSELEEACELGRRGGNSTCVVLGRRRKN